MKAMFHFFNRKVGQMDKVFFFYKSKVHKLLISCSLHLGHQMIPIWINKNQLLWFCKSLVTLFLLVVISWSLSYIINIKWMMGLISQKLFKMSLFLKINIFAISQKVNTSRTFSLLILAAVGRSKFKGSLKKVEPYWILGNRSINSKPKL